MGICQMNQPNSHIDSILYTECMRKESESEKDSSNRWYSSYHVH